MRAGIGVEIRERGTAGKTAEVDGGASAGAEETAEVDSGSVSLSVYGGMMCISTHTPLPRGTRITPHQALCVFPPS